MVISNSDSGVTEQIENFSCFVSVFNSRGTNGVLNAIFPFWAKMKTVIMASSDDFSKNFRTRNKDHEF